MPRVAEELPEGADYDRPNRVLIQWSNEQSRTLAHVRSDSEPYGLTANPQNDAFVFSWREGSDLIIDGYYLREILRRAGYDLHD